MYAKHLSIGWAMKQPEPAKALRFVLDNLQNWGRQESQTFSRLAGERFTHAEVVAAHLAVAALLAVCSIAETI